MYVINTWNKEVNFTLSMFTPVTIKDWKVENRK